MIVSSFQKIPRVIANLKENMDDEFSSQKLQMLCKKLETVEICAASGQLTQAFSFVQNFCCCRSVALFRYF